MHSIDERYMRRCFELALNGAGRVAPNPLVGCVIVHEERIIGEGFHRQFGGPHAEVNAINSVLPRDKHLLPSSMLYVNLEPCSHYGKTPPCADLIIENKIPEIIIGCVDPNPLVSGNGIKKLQQSGSRVTTGIMEKESRHLNRRFITWIEKKRPYIILKWAQTADGFIAPPDRSRLQISNAYTRILTHKWRSEEAGIMVGTVTAERDNPLLDARLWNNNNPVRIVIDRTLRLSRHLHLFNRDASLIVFNAEKTEKEGNIIFEQIDFSKEALLQITDRLYRSGIQSVLVEGGSILLQSFIDKNCWDEARIITGPTLLTSGVTAPGINGTVLPGTDIHSDHINFIENR